MTTIWSRYFSTGDPWRFLNKAVIKGGTKVATDFHPHHNQQKFNEVVNRCKHALALIPEEYDTIAVRGASGTVVGSVLAYLTGKKLAVIRKDGENPHCYAGVSCADVPNPSRTVWLDDFIGGGGTYAAVIKALRGRPRWVILYYTGTRFACVSPLQAGLVSHTQSDYLFVDAPNGDTEERFMWKP